MSNSAINHCGQLARNPLVQAIHAALFLGASSGHAATFEVMNQNNAGPGSLRQAIMMANFTPGPDNIIFAPGVSTITLSTGQLEVTDELTITGPTGGVTINGGGLSRVLAVTNNTSPLTLENLTITNGATTVGSIYSPMNSCSVSDGSGAGICTLSALTLTNSVVSGNRTTGNYAPGGGIFAYNSPLTLTNSTLSGNSTVGDSARGGGIFAFGTELTLSNSTLSDNHTSGKLAEGGGIAALICELTLSNSTLSGNSTAGEDAYGGGISTGNTLLTLSNSTVSGNTTTGENASGGGVATFSGGLTVSNSTMSGNSVTGANALGGGIYALTSPVTLSSSILAGNTDTGGGGNFHEVVTSSLTAGDSLFGDDASEITTDNGNNVLSDAPGLAALADNGCAVEAGAPASATCVQTQALLPGSPALDAGNDNGLSFDQRGNGFPRIVGPRADIGAFESPFLNLPTPPTPTGSSSSPEAIPVLGSWGLLAMLSSLLALIGLRRSRS